MTDSNPIFDKLITDSVGFLNAGSPGESADASGQALKLAPERCEGYFTLAVAAYLLDDLGRALEMAQKGHDIAPDCREGCDVMAHLHAHAGNINDSVYFAKIASTGNSFELLSPLKITGLDNLADAIDSTNKTDYMTEAMRCLNEERYADAIAVCEKGVRLRKDDPAIYSTFGKALLGDGRIGQGVSALHAAVHINPDNESVRLQLGNAYYRSGEPALAMACHRGVLETSSSDGDVLAQISHGYAGYSSDIWPDLDDAVSAWHKSNGQKIKQTADIADDDVIKVGLVFDRACVSDELSYIEPLMLNFDRNRFAISIFSRDVPGDPVANRLKGLCQNWTDIRDMTDDVVIGAVKAIGIDVLVDATVTPDGHRPGVFAAHPAPVTVGWLTPKSGIFEDLYDHFLSDLNKNLGGVAIDGNNMAEIKGRSPVQARGHVTFAALCDFSRIPPDMVRIWSTILRSVDDSKLLLGGVDVIPDDIKRRAHELFSAFGAVDRIEFVELGARGHEDRLIKRLEFMVGADVYLDTFPMSGRTDVNCALWCGLPVVSNANARGQGPGAVQSATLDEWLADKPGDYVEKAIAAAAFVSEKNDCRSDIYERVKSSLMCDPKQWATMFGDTLAETLDAS